MVPLWHQLIYPDNVRIAFGYRTATTELLLVGRLMSGVKSRRVFQATSAGRKAARRNVSAVITELRTIPHPFLIGLANLPLLAEHAYAEALRTRLTQVEARIASVEDAEQAQAPLPLPAREVFSYSLGLLEAERSWLAARVQVPDE